MDAKFLAQPDGDVRLGDFLQTNLAERNWTTFRAAIAFVKKSGVDHIRAALATFAQRGEVKLSVGVSFRGTSVEGLASLHEVVGGRGEIWIFHNENGSTFHPKVYLFRNDTNARIAIGSGNLTEGGLFTNYEAGIELQLSLTNPEDRRTFDAIVASLDQWSNPTVGTARLLDDALLDELVARGYLPPEVYSRETEEAGAAEGEGGETPLFATVAVKAAPPRPGPAPVPPPPQQPRLPVFMMTLQRTDVGVGQTTPGTAPRSPEVFIPLVARDAMPDFWDWPSSFTEDPNREGKMDRTQVRMLIGTRVEYVNMMTWPAKRDFRLRSEALRSSGSVGDILRIEKTDGVAGYSYVVTVIPRGSREYSTALAQCVHTVRNSAKLWCYL